MSNTNNEPFNPLNRRHSLICDFVRSTGLYCPKANRYEFSSNRIHFPLNLDSQNLQIVVVVVDVVVVVVVLVVVSTEK